MLESLFFFSFFSLPVWLFFSSSFSPRALFFFQPFPPGRSRAGASFTFLKTDRARFRAHPGPYDSFSPSHTLGTGSFFISAAQPRRPSSGLRLRTVPLFFPSAPRTLPGLNFFALLFGERGLDPFKPIPFVFTLVFFRPTGPNHGAVVCPGVRTAPSASPPPPCFFTFAGVYQPFSLLSPLPPRATRSRMALSFPWQVALFFSCRRF